MFRNIFWSTILLIASPSLVFAQDVLTSRQWLEDLQFMQEQMPRKHRNLYHSLKEQDFKASIEDLQKRVPALQRHQIIVEIAKIVASLNDGHAMIDGFMPPLENGFRTLPVRMYSFSDGVFIRSSHKSLTAHLGAKVLSIGGVDIDEALERASKIVFHDNKMGQKELAVYYLTSPEILNALGITNETEKAVFVLEKDSRPVTVEFTPLPMEHPNAAFGIVNDPEWVDASELSPNPKPLWLQNLDKMYWYSFDPEARTMYVQFNQFNNQGSQSVVSFFDEVIAKSRTVDLKRFILDIRLNRGGETTLVAPVVKRLLAQENINRKGTFFVVIGRRTFSSAQLLCNALKQFSYATFVGEQTGARPKFYANSRNNVVLPNSGLILQMPTKYWQTTHEQDYRKWQSPGIRASLSIVDYLKNVDPAMTAIENEED